MSSQKDKYVALLDNYQNKFRPANFTLREGTSITDMDYDYLESFLQWRLWAERYMLITSAYRPGDPRAHGQGLALDVILFNEWLQEVTDPIEQWQKATTWPFLGVGIYFDWHYTDKNGDYRKAVGLHVDRHVSKRPVRWLRMTKEVSGKSKPQRLYYYQSTKTGLFYNNDINETVSLNDAIKRWKN